jgi:hypothetical protein
VLPAEQVVIDPGAVRNAGVELGHRAAPPRDVP